MSGIAVRPREARSRTATGQPRRRRAGLAAAMLAAWLLPPTGEPAGADVPQELAAASMILVVVPHPDDEVFVAPLLASLCKGRDPQRCHLLTFTTGAAGRCLLATCDASRNVCPDAGACPCGCWDPTAKRWQNLATIRHRELTDVAAYLGLGLSHWDYPNDPEGTVQSRLDAWAEWAGDSLTLVANLAGTMAAVGADKLLILDPRHGSTCHVEHRALARVAIEAARATAGLDPEDVFLIQTLFDPGLHDVPCQPTCKRFIWEGFRPALGGPFVEIDGAANWGDLQQVVALYASQFLPPSLAAAGAEQKKSWLVRLTDVDLSGESPYVPECSVQQRCDSPCP